MSNINKTLCVDSDVYDTKHCNLYNDFFTELQYLNESLSLIDVPEDIVTGKCLTLSCACSTYFFEDYPFWEIRDQYGKSRILSNSSGNGSYRNIDYIYFFFLHNIKLKKFKKIKSVAYSSQGSHTGQLDFCN